MTSCDRFEREGLPRLEAGQPPDEHELACADCRDARRRYEQLCLALSELPAVKAPAGWEQKVFAALPNNDAGPASEPEPQSGQAVVGRSPAYVAWIPWVGLAAAAAAVFIFVTTREPPVKALAVRQEVVANAAGRRADSAVVGDTLRITAQGGVGSVRELRLYRNTRELVARCPGESGNGEAPNSNARPSNAGCTVEAGSPTLSFPLSVAGSYRSLIIVGPQQAPEPSGSLDEDARAAAAAGAEVEMSLAVEVQ